MKKLLAVMMMATTLQVQAQQVGTWATAAEYTGQGDMPRMSLAETSLRQIIRVSIGGTKHRMQFSNEFSSEPVEIKTVYLADAKDSCDINAKKVTYLSFGGKRSVTIPAGATVWSDDFKRPIQPLQRLSVTIQYGKQVPEHATSHRGSRTTSYIARGAVKPGKPFPTVEKVDHWYNMVKLNTLTECEAVAILGNSITDGRGSTTNLQNRWPDFMATALNANVDGSEGVGVLNLGIGGNCVVEGGLSEPALKRFDRDILGQSGVKTLIIFEGTNDLGISNGNTEQVVKKLIAAYQTLIDKAHQAGMKVYGGTITPFKGNGWYSYFHEAGRRTVNDWIRTSGKFDGIVDFDQLVRDPNDPEKLRAEYSEDWLHLNPRGYEAMGKYAAEVIMKGDR